jgi:tetratricopeptide (TPR) repeat protein
MTPHSAKLQEAVALHRDGRLEAARALYEQVLAEDPRQVDALHLMGVIATQTNDPHRALHFIDLALEILPSNALMHYNRGRALQLAVQWESAVAAYDRAIELDPRYREACLNRGFALKELRRFEAALASYEQALAIDPGFAAAHSNRADVLRELGRYESALASCNRAIELDPGFADAHCHRGAVYESLRRYPEAIANFDQAIALRPGYAEAHSNRGNALCELGSFDRALESYDRALAVDPGSGTVHSNRGNLLRRQGRWEEALRSYDLAIASRPPMAEAYLNRGVLLRELGRCDAALEDYDRALALRPDLAEAHSNRGNALEALGRAQEALAAYHRALELRGNFAAAHVNRGVLLRQLGQFEAALADYDRALELQPDLAEAHSNRGNALESLARYQESLQSYDRALALNPRSAEAYTNRAILLCDLGRHADAAADHDQAVALQLEIVAAFHSGPPERLSEDGALPAKIRADLAEVYFNRSISLLRAGNFAQGWQEYEWRWLRKSVGPDLHVERYRPRLWLGAESLAGKTILLHFEQGLGDTLQFCRYAGLVAALGASVVLEVQPPLLRLLSRLAGPARVLTRETELPACDFRCPLMSLPLAFRTELATIPTLAHYLCVDPSQREQWRARLGDGGRPRVGLMWSGNPNNVRDRYRSLSLATLRAALPAHCDYVSLAKEIRTGDRDAVAAHPPLIDFSDEQTDFEDAAALCTCVDLVISIDTSIAHLAGALGLETWVLLSATPDWRWLLGRHDSPWYPSLRLFRQKRIGDWDGVLAQLREALILKFSGGRTPV